MRINIDASVLGLKNAYVETTAKNVRLAIKYMKELSESQRVLDRIAKAELNKKDSDDDSDVYAMVDAFSARGKQLDAVEDFLKAIFNLNKKQVEKLENSDPENLVELATNVSGKIMMRGEESESNNKSIKPR